MPTVIVTKRGEDRIESGHPWVYRSDIAEVRAAAGEIVRVSGPRNRVLGEALFSDRSQIVIRMMTRGDARADDALFRRRIEQAIQFRETLKIEGTAYRLLHGEADLVRMSGSGATCFGLYRSHDVMLKAAEKLSFRRPEWWQLAGELR